MNIVDVIKLSALIICCILATKTDLQHGTISNKLVVVFGIMGILLDVISIFVSSPDENILFLQNALSLIVISFILYFLKIWAGGDCKLLIVVALLFPSSLYWRLSLTQFTLWYTLGFMFGTGLLYLMTESIILWLREEREGFLKDFFWRFIVSIKYYVKALVFLSGFSHIYLKFVYPHFHLPTIIYTSICIVYIWILNRCHFFDSKIILGLLVFFDVAMTLITGNITLSTMWEAYLITVSFMIIRIFINRYNYKIIDAVDIEKGMILSRMSSLVMQNSTIKGLPDISDESLRSRITSEEVASVIRWSKTKNGYKQIVIVRKMPFAVFISCGVLMYLLFRGVLQ